MKITINKVLLFLQAILLLTGLPVVAMEEDGEYKLITDEEAAKLSSEEVDRLMEEHQRDFNASLAERQRLLNANKAVNESTVAINSSTVAKEDILKEDSKQSEEKVDQDCNNKSSGNVDQNYNNKSSQEVLQQYNQEPKPLEQVSFIEPFPKGTPDITFNWNGDESKVEKTYEPEEKETYKPYHVVTSLYPVGKFSTSTAPLEKTGAFTSVASKMVAAKQLGLNIIGGAKNAVIGGATKTMTGASGAAHYVAGKVKNGASKTMNGVHSVSSYVGQTPVVQNPLVGTGVSLGKTVFNAASSWLTRTGDYVRESIDLVGVNVKYNVFNNLETALETLKSLPDNNLGSHLLDNQDIAITYTDKNKKIRAIGAVLERMKPESTVTYTDVQNYIENEKDVYKPIKQELELILGQSYAEISHKHTLVDELNDLTIKTKLTVSKKIELFKAAVEKRFNDFKIQTEQVKAKNEKEQAQLNKKIKQYDDIQKALFDAADLYQNVFLIDVMLCNLLKIDTTFIDVAIDFYKNYIDWLAEYKKIIAKLQKNNVALTKDYAVKSAGADFIIDLSKKEKKLSFTISQLCFKQSKVFDQYKKLLIKMPTAFNYRLSKIPSNFNGVYKHLYKFIESDEFTFLTQAQCKYVEEIAKTLDQEKDVLDNAYQLVEHFTPLVLINECINKYERVEKALKNYTEKSFKDELEAVSLEDLTVNRSEGIKKLVGQHGSVRNMIKWAENEQVAYEKRQEKRFDILGDDIKKTVSDLIVYLDKQPTDEKLSMFDSGLILCLKNSAIADTNTYTSKQRQQLTPIIKAAFEDAKNSIKIAIIAGWTVLGVEAKMAFEELAKTEGSDATSAVKRGLGNALNMVRKGLIGTGNEISKDEYHKQTRKEIKEGVAKAFKTTATEVQNILKTMETELSNKWKNGKKGRDSIIKNLKKYKKQIQDSMKLKSKIALNKITLALDHAINDLEDAKLPEVIKTIVQRVLSEIYRIIKLEELEDDEVPAEKSELNPVVIAYEYDEHFDDEKPVVLEDVTEIVEQTEINSNLQTKKSDNNLSQKDQEQAVQGQEGQKQEGQKQEGHGQKVEGQEGHGQKVEGQKVQGQEGQGQEGQGQAVQKQEVQG